jgi:alcohol dehydrogenase (cytochrome c)
VFTVGKDGVLWKLDRKTGKYLGHKETVFQNVWEKFDPQTGTPMYRADIIDHEVGQWIDGCPSTEGGHNWQAMSHNRATNQLIIPLSQSCIAIRAQKIEQKEAAAAAVAPIDASTRCRAPTATSASSRAFDVNTHEGDVVAAAARAVPDGGALDGRRRRVRRRSRSHVQGRRRAHGQDPVADAARHVGPGLPDVVQRRWQAVHRGDDGLGGGSPRLVPSTLAPEIRVPTTGQALYVFALPRRGTRGQGQSQRSRKDVMMISPCRDCRISSAFVS